MATKDTALTSRTAPGPRLAAGAGFVAVVGLSYAAQHVWGWWPVLAAIAATLLVVAVGLALPRAAAGSAGPVAHIVTAVMALGLLVVPVTLALLHPTLADWIPVYLAGAVGGLVLELIDARWQVEVPGPAGAPVDPDKDYRQTLLAEVDLGVCGRALTGGLAAFVVVMLGAAATADDVDRAVTEASGSVLSLAVAVAVGAASVAAWDAIRRTAATRWEVLEGAQAALATAHEAARKAADGNVPPSDGGPVTAADAASRAAMGGGRHDDAALAAATTRAGEALGAIRAAEAVLDVATAGRGRRGR